MNNPKLPDDSYLHHKWHNPPYFEEVMRDNSKENLEKYSDMASAKGLPNKYLEAVTKEKANRITFNGKKLQSINAPCPYLEEIVKDKPTREKQIDQLLKNVDLHKLEPKQDLGYKIEKGKLDLTVLPWLALCEVAKVFHFGLKEHPKNSWKKGFKESTCDASYLRHQLQFRFGMDEDSQSQLPHLAHAAWWALVKLELYMKGNLVRDLDESDILNGDYDSINEIFYDIDSEELLKQALKDSTNGK